MTEFIDNKGNELNLAIENFKKLNIRFPRSNSEEGFESLLMIINSRNAIKATFELIKSLEKKSQHECCIYPKEFLTAYMITENPKDIFNEIGVEENEIINLSKDLLTYFQDTIDNFYNQNESIYNLVTMMNNYKQRLNEWKEIDKQKLLVTLSQAYFELSKTREYILAGKEELTPDQVIWSQEIIKQKRKLESKAFQLDGQTGKEFMINYEPPLADMEMYKQVNEMAQKAYWDAFVYDLSQEPPKYERLYCILGEVRDKLCKLLKHRDDIKQQIRSSVDPDMVKQMIENNVFDNTEFMKLFTFITEQIKRFHSPSDDSEFENWKTGFVAMLNERKPYVVILPIFFKEMIKRIDKIENDIFAFQELVRTTPSK